MVQKDIRFKFEINNHATGETRRYEAVGFLEEGERVSMADMFTRVVNAIDEEDLVFLGNSRDQIPSDPQLTPCLLMGDYHPQDGHCWAFFFDGSMPVYRWTPTQIFDLVVHSGCLILRRLP